MRILGVDIPERKREDLVVSYTQFSAYQKCPKSWELKYAKRLGKYEPNIYLLFGTVIHDTIQLWIKSMFDGDESYDYVDCFRKNMMSEFDKLVTRWGTTFTDLDTLMEFHDDGIEILHYLKHTLRRYFNPRKYNFLGFEIPIVYQCDESKPKLKFRGHLDLVFQEIGSGRYMIMDIKTSTNGWGFYQQTDMSKQSQLVLYKYFFSKMFNVPIDNIDTLYFIVKRKLKDDTPWGNSRVQEYSPIQSTQACESIANEFETFVRESFDHDGTPRTDIEYPAISGDDGKNCKFCEFSDFEEHCPKKNRK